MTELLFSSPLLFALFGSAAVFSLLSKTKKGGYWAVFSVLCAITGTLVALVQGRTMDDILSALLVLTAISLFSLPKKEGGGNP